MGAAAAGGVMGIGAREGWCWTGARLFAEVAQPAAVARIAPQAARRVRLARPPVSATDCGSREVVVEAVGRVVE
jgi:hypothetical protein